MGDSRFRFRAFRHSDKGSFISLSLKGSSVRRTCEVPIWLYRWHEQEVPIRVRGLGGQGGAAIHGCCVVLQRRRRAKVTFPKHYRITPSPGQHLSQAGRGEQRADVSREDRLPTP